MDPDRYDHGGSDHHLPGRVALAAGLPDSIKQFTQCNGGEYLLLTKRQSRGVYHQTLSNIPTESMDGVLTSVHRNRVRARKTQPEIPTVDYLIFEDFDNADDPQAYHYRLDQHGQRLSIWKSARFQGMNHPEVELIFTKQN